jgi:hypothetical protein
MLPRSENTRIARIRIWILVLTLIPAGASLLPHRTVFAAGLATGGLIMFLNLLGTQRTVTLMIEGDAIERLVAVLVWFGKFGITAAYIFGLLYWRIVDPLALLIGLGSLPVSLVFDIFLFPVNKGEAKKP